MAMSSGKQGGGSVTHIVMGYAFHVAQTHRQHGLGAIFLSAKFFAMPGPLRRVFAIRECAWCSTFKTILVTECDRFTWLN